MLLTFKNNFSKILILIKQLGSLNRNYIFIDERKLFLQ